MIDDKSEPGSWARDMARRPADAVIPATPLTPPDRWWAERWLKSATPSERAAMRELLAL